MAFSNLWTRTSFAFGLCFGLRIGLPLRLCGLVLLAGSFESSASRGSATCIEWIINDPNNLKRPNFRGILGGEEGAFGLHTKFGKIHVVSDIGAGIKYNKNEDSAFVLKSEDKVLMGVIDGMGSPGSGDVASQLSALSIATDIQNKKSLKQAVLRANLGLWNAVERGHGNNEMGAVAVFAEVRGNSTRITHLGDAKSVIIKNSEPSKIHFQTKDHSVVQELLDEGKITPEKAAKHPDRNIVSRTISVMAPFAERDQPEQSGWFDLAENDLIILGSDGLWDHITPEKVPEIIAGLKTPEAITSALRETIRRLAKVNKESFSDDNISILVYRHLSSS